MPKLTKRFIDKLEPPSKNPGKDLTLWDDDIKGFGIRVKPSGVKTYMIQYRAEGTSCRMALGRHGVLTPEEVTLNRFGQGDYSFANAFMDALLDPAATKRIAQMKRLSPKNDALYKKLAAFFTMTTGRGVLRESRR